MTDAEKYTRTQIRDIIGDEWEPEFDEKPTPYLLGFTQSMVERMRREIQILKEKKR
jgi:hypothetical protein